MAFSHCRVLCIYIYAGWYEREGNILYVYIYIYVCLKMGGPPFNNHGPWQSIEFLPKKASISLGSLGGSGG